jgi:hypothetical protein
VNLQGVSLRIERARADRQIRRQVERVEDYLARAGAAGEPDDRPVLFFNASTRIHTLSLNAAFSLLASWSLRLAGVPVRYVVCQAGMHQCILGTRSTGEQRPPPCGPCVRFSELLFPAELTISIGRPGANSEGLGEEPLESLIRYRYRDIPLGELCLPGLRWALRRHHLLDDGPTRRLFAEYVRSAVYLADRLEWILADSRPRAVVVFNGVMYPEAVARAVARRMAIPVVTHEVGLRPYSAFFSHELATFRELDPPDPNGLPAGWEQELDRYLEQRRRGRFEMAGIEFWPTMVPLPDRLGSKLAQGQPLISVFTNVVFDTSQVHANALYPDMFAWLDEVAQTISSHPETVFVIRAHPDEDRPGKASQESVSGWVEARGLNRLDNLVFMAPGEYVSSYELIRRSKAVLVYSSSVGLEAAIMGVPVLCAGRARYSRIDGSLLPQSVEHYRMRLTQLVTSEDSRLAEASIQRARVFLYTELYRASLDFSELLEPYPTIPGMVRFKSFHPIRLQTSPALEIAKRGILEGQAFLLPDHGLHV